MKNHEKNGSDGRNESNGKNESCDNSNYTPHNSHSSHTSHGKTAPKILNRRGDYQNLLSYQKSDVIYQITYRFCQRFFQKNDRTVDQMVQAARSGKQNIIEGSKAAVTSKETEIKLTNVARASLEELLEDYRDYLKTRDLRIWDKQSRQAIFARKLGMTVPLSYALFRDYTDNRSAEIVANIAICLIHQANYLLDKQLQHLEEDFTKNGGLRERMTRARLETRKNERN